MTSPDIFGTPLPYEEDYLKAIQRTTQEERINSEQTMANAIARGKIRPDYRDFVQRSGRAAMMLEPFDRSFGAYVDDNREVSRAVAVGAAFGGLVVSRVHGDIVGLRNIGLPYPKAALEDQGADAELRHAQAIQINEFAGHGLALIGSHANDLLEDIEMYTVASVAKQRFFRVGFGVVMCAALDAHIVHNQNQKEQSLLQLNEGTLEIDWDSALNDLG